MLDRRNIVKEIKDKTGLKKKSLRNQKAELEKRSGPREGKGTKIRRPIHLAQHLIRVFQKEKAQRGYY